MDNIEVTADDLPTAKVDTGYNTVDGKDKQTIFPAKSSCPYLPLQVADHQR